MTIRMDQGTRPKHRQNDASGQRLLIEVSGVRHDVRLHRSPRGANRIGLPAGESPASPRIG